MSQLLPSNENKSAMRLMLEEREFIFDKTYKRLQKINEGAFGEVFRGVNIHNHELVAIKFEKPNTKIPNTLEREAKFLKHLKGIKGIPKIFSCGKQHNVKIIVMELLGNSLNEKLAHSSKLSLKSILIIADQILEILKNIHAKGVLHRDIKPDNILFGIYQESKDIYLTDFGISKLYLDQNKCHIPFETDCAFVGTIRFASEAAHKGHQLSRRDDLESLGYILVYLLKGTLPWLNLKNLDVYQRKKMVGELKSSLYLDELCSNIPSVFSIYLKYVKRLGFYENPDYDYMQKLFSSLLNSLDIKIENHNWEWSDYHSMKTTETTKKITSSPCSVDKSKFLNDSNNTKIDKRDQKVQEKNDKSIDEIEETNKSQRIKKKSFTLNANSIKGLNNVTKDTGKKIEDEVKLVELAKKSRKSLGFGCESVFLDFHKIMQKVDKDDNQIKEEDHENDDEKYEDSSAFYKQEIITNNKSLMSLGNPSNKSNKSFTNLLTSNSVKAKSRFADSIKDQSLNSNANISFENDKKSDFSQNGTLKFFVKIKKNNNNF